MMPVPPDFPDIADAKHTLQTVIYQNHHDLRNVAEGVMDELGNVIAANKEDQDGVMRQMRQQIVGKITANKNDCARIADLISQIDLSEICPQPIVPPVPTANGGSGDCQQTPPVCGDPGSVFWCLHFISGPSEYWQVFCDSPEVIGIVADRLNAIIYGSWLTYDEALQCCCSHASNCPSTSGPPANGYSHVSG